MSRHGASVAVSELAVELEVVRDRRRSPLLSGARELDGDDGARRGVAVEVTRDGIEQRPQPPPGSEELHAAEQAQLRHVPTLDVDERRVERACDVERRTVGEIGQLEVQHAVLEGDVDDDAVVGLSSVHLQARERPSCAISSVSIATSFPFAFRVGPSHLEIHPWKNIQRTTSVRSSSRRMMAPFRRSTFPSSTLLRQFHSSASCVIPRLRTRLAYFVSPGSLRTVLLSTPRRYSMTSVSLARPLTSLKPREGNAVDLDEE